MRSIALLVFLAACTPSPYRLGVKAAKDGRYVDATAHWLVALDADIYARRPRRALRDHAYEAWEQRLDRARELEAARRYSEAVDAYQGMLDYARDLDEVELLAFSTADAQAELAATRLAWAMSERARGTVAHEAGDHATAVAAFDRARELEPQLVGLDAEQGAAYEAWARQDLEAHRYQDAADHFRAAHALTGEHAQDAWAAAVEVGLGRYALSRGACRTAVKHFERAGHVVGDRELESDRARALDCSRLGLLMDPVQEAIEHDGRALSIGSMLLDRIEQEVDQGGSRFVRILAPEVLSSIEDPPEHQVRVTVRVNQATLDAPAERTEKQRTTGVRVVPCDQEVLLYSPEEVCTEEVEVEYVLHRTAQSVRMAGSVKLVDLSSGEQSTRPVDVEVTHDTTHATDFQLFEAGTTVPITIGTEAAVGRVELPEAIVALDRPPMALPTGEEMLVDAVRTLASEFAHAILETVDSDGELPAPRQLLIRDPLLAPEDVELVPAEAPVIPAEPEPVDEPVEQPVPVETEGVPEEADPEPSDVVDEPAETD